MNSSLSVGSDRDIERFVQRVDAIFCIRCLIITNIAISCLKVLVIGLVLYITRMDNPEVPLKLFLSVYAAFSIFKGTAFYIKNKQFFHINRIQEFDDNNDAALINNFIEAVMLFWYIVGFHWLQECGECGDIYPVLYYTTIFVVVLGFIGFIAPLFAILLLLLFMAYVRPKLKVISFQSEEDIPDRNCRCVICFDEYRKGNRIKFLPCNHHFHSDCVDEWFNVKDSCPLCKANVNLLYDLVDATDTIV